MKKQKPHFDKLQALLSNTKLPEDAKESVEQSITRYKKWIEDLEAVELDSDGDISPLVKLFNDYKFYIDYDLIYSSKSDFLYRQKGQLKLDNTVIEEFLPHLVKKAFPNWSEDLEMGSIKCFSEIHFNSSIHSSKHGGGLLIKEKDQDFAIARKLHIRTSHNSSFKSFDSKDTYIAYLAAECKTNLDKTMFQEASATAHDVKAAVPGSKYLLLCEWLDMTPTSTSSTDIDEVLILRKAKRLSSNIRKEFNTYNGRQKNSEFFKNFLNENPFSENVFKRFISHIQELDDDKNPIEKDVLNEGYF